jgi:predicted TIM-barrel fold metal-dependent hydrolase
MKIVHGLISGDSHAQLDRDAFTNRMSRAKWGDRIPQVLETTNPAFMFKAMDFPVERWFVNGQVVDKRWPANCPALMNDATRSRGAQRWEDVPRTVYDPIERLKVLDSDGVDGEVLFPNPPVQNATFFQGDAELELACVQAYNDALADWRRASDRYVPLALIPYLSGIEASVAEVVRAAKIGHGGILMVVEPSLAIQGRNDVLGLSGPNAGLNALPHFCSTYWDPLWAACQDCEMPVHWHANAGISLRGPAWKDFSFGEESVSFLPGAFCLPTQFLPNLLFSGVLDRYPRLKWVWAEIGIGWIQYVLESCDHEWERRHLWTEGLVSRPSELFKRQIYSMFWFEKAGVELRDALGQGNLMWESDFPHSTSTYPESRKFVEHSMEGVSDEDRRQLLYGNALRLYKM